MIRLADYVMLFLESIGIEDVFTVSGGGSIFLDDALGQSKIKYYCCHHEQAVAMASEAYARVNGEIGVSLVTSGPGGTNAITGVAGCWIDSVPNLIISGQVYLNQTIGDSGLRQLGVQEINIIDIVDPITKYAVMVKKANKIKYHLQKAVHIAKTGRPGPVWVDIPADIQRADINENELEEFTPNENPTSLDSNLKSKVTKIAQLLKSSKRPLIHVGQGVKISKATKEFLAFVKSYDLPFVTARNANDIVATNHELYVGRPGTFGQRGANFAVQNSDFYLAIGTRLALSQTGYFSRDYARNAKKVMVDIDQTELDKKTLSIDIKVQSDAKVFLMELNQELSGVSLDISSWIRQCQHWKEKYPVMIPEHKRHKSPVNSYYFVDILSEILTSKDVIVTDMGIAFQGTHQAFKIKEGQKLFTNSGFAAMGWGLPASIGACVANQNKRTICISGDGGLQLNIQELATIMHNKLPIKLFVLNNGGYLTIKQTQEHGFGGQLMGCNQATGLSFPDVLKLAEAYKIRSIRLDNQENLKHKLKQVVDSKGPVVCEIIMDPDQKQIPKVLNRKKPDGTMEASPVEDMYPYLAPEELKENMLSD
ncbi:TPA: thiamine pyrophosphate-binding protein [Candidatus Poribacteria bacterium]|nr:thiamine pyrophosphate-binding protein [Candidatus Poribacteria bacterium]